MLLSMLNGVGGWVKGRVLSKGVKFGVKFNKQGLGALCCAVRVLNKEDKVEWKDTTYPPILYVLPTQT
jgi:hypothetical protein